MLLDKGTHDISLSGGGFRRISETAKAVRNACGTFAASKAELIARTETGKLNTAIARNQMESAGIEYYEWGAAMDGRTRESHALMDGRICKWGDDSHCYEWTDGKNGRRLKRVARPKGAYEGAPGTDFQCRCVAIPYVPEYEKGYERGRAKGPVRGVVQGSHAEPETAAGLAKVEEEKRLAREESRRRRTLLAVEEMFGKDKVENAIKINENLFVAKERFEEGHKGNNQPVYEKELAVAEMMSASGHTVFLLPESGPVNANGKHPDAFMDGLVSEIKVVTGNRSKIGRNFMKSQRQAEVSVLRVTDEAATFRDCIDKIYGSILAAMKDGKPINENSRGCWILLNGSSPLFLDVARLIRRAMKNK